MPEAEIVAFMERIKAEGRSSPAGQHWAAFFDLLRRHALRAGVERPPMSLILAAAGESDASKHQRLAEQLRWARAHGCPTEAMKFLEELRPEQWNQGDAKTWHRSTY